LIEILVDPFPDPAQLEHFWQRAWGAAPSADYDRVLERSLCHIAAKDGGRLVGFVNVGWDGGVHAFLLDTAVDPDYRRHGLATSLVQRATEISRARGAEWLHVDFEARLGGFYAGCGFRPTAAGLIKLR
jgi:GNAT superfamily N-acetyltransferase